MNFNKAFISLLQGRDISPEETEHFLEQIVRKNISEAQAKTALLLLAKKGESSGEVLGGLRLIRRLEPSYRHSFKKLLDTCGTGGDGSHSLNISTLAAIVIAGAGAKVAKHGNRGLSSKCGSSDLMEACGVKLEAKSSNITRSIERNGIGYVHAPAHHPVFAEIQPLRRKLKTRTLFNLLGPLVNPFNPLYQLIGVASKRVFEVYVEALKKTNVTALVCRSADGMDEISVSCPTEAVLISKGKTKRFTIRPEKLFSKKNGVSIRGGAPAENAAVSKKLLEGKIEGPARNAVVLNAAAGLYLLGIAKSFEEGIRKAEESLDLGKALKALQGMAETQS